MDKLYKKITVPNDLIFLENCFSLFFSPKFNTFSLFLI